jgi:hypothetical protein
LAQDLPERNPLADLWLPYPAVAEVAGVVYLALAISISFVDPSVSLPRRILVVVGLGLLSFECAGFRDRVGERWFLLGLGMCVAFGLWVHGVVYGNLPVEGIYLPCNIGVALAIVRGHLRARSIGLVLLTLTAVLGARLIAAKGSLALVNVLAISSANGVSEFMIALTGTYYLCARSEGRPVRLAPALSCALLSALALGRSGIGGSLILLLGVGLAAFGGPRAVRRGWAMGLLDGGLLLGAGGFLAAHFDQIRFVLNRFQRFGIGSESRQAIWAEYLSRLQGAEVLFGFDRSAEFAGYRNVHNSYVYWHRELGILAVPLYVLTVLAIGFSAKRGVVVLSALAALLFRSFFDETILPFRLHDYAYFALVTTAFLDPSPGPVENDSGQVSVGRAEDVAAADGPARESPEEQVT